MSSSSRTILLTGATGYVGGRLAPELVGAGHRVRCLVRRPAAADLPAEAEAVQGDVLDGSGLDEALRGVEVAFYLVHSMGRGSGPAAGFAARDRRAARNFGEAAARAGVERVVYLGGLAAGGVAAASEHLRSREEVARILREHVREVVHVRAAMVIGSGSASFEILRHLVRRLPVMVTPRWIDTRSQPVAIADVVHALAVLADFEDPPPDVELGGRDVLTYRQMMFRLARALGRPAPVVVRVPVLTPGLSSYWVALVTPVDLGLIKPLVHGLTAEMVVRTPPPAGINDSPLGFNEAVRRALAAGVRVS
jgi:uncharacterized protein YbjT (DUF2867 family)